MSAAWDPSARALVTLLPQTGRGPRRDGIFALWLTLRVAQDLFTDTPPSDRAHRRRVAALDHRLSSLTLPPPLRRALTAAIAELRSGDPAVAAQVLSQLVAPARESVGADVADALGVAARAARAMLQRA
jgi:hypothetical protein